jgi:glucose-1-phosphate adenylyltransferase
VGGYNNRGFVEVLAASQSPVRKEWFQGTADAVRQYLWLFEEAVRDGVEDFLILSGERGGGGPVRMCAGTGAETGARREALPVRALVNPGFA